MPVGKKKSPAKFIGAVSLGLGVIKGATSIIGGIQERRRLEKAAGRRRYLRNQQKLKESRGY